MILVSPRIEVAFQAAQVVLHDDRFEHEPTAVEQQRADDGHPDKDEAFDGVAAALFLQLLRFSQQIDPNRHKSQRS